MTIPLRLALARAPAKTLAYALVVVLVALLQHACLSALAQGQMSAIPPTQTAQFDTLPRHSGWRAGGAPGTGVAWFGDTSWTSFTATTAASATAVTYNTQTLDFTATGGDNSAAPWPTSGITIGSANSRFTLSMWFCLGPISANTPGAFPSLTVTTQPAGNLVHFGAYVNPAQPSVRYLMAYWSGSYYLSQVPQWTAGQW